MTARGLTIVASELLGRPGTGGAGTADSLLAIALARHGHRVRLLIASGREIGAINPEWARRYESAGVEIRVLERVPGVRPSYLAPALEVCHALRDEPPDVAIVNDWRGLGYAALRARQGGRALTDTAFVVHCHSPGRVLTEFAQKVPDTLDRFGEHVAERASIELADAVVSPSTWLLDWLRAHAWPVPASAQVIQYVRESAALDETPEQAPSGEAIRRLAFFGQLREGKGIRIFLHALELVEPRLLEGVEVVFLGSARGRWASDRVLAALPTRVSERLGDIRFEAGLAREAALAELRVPGTLAVMPSLLDNSPNTVSECIEHGVAFVSTDVGGIPELVAEADRRRVLCAPTAHDLAAALTDALSSPSGVAPAQPAREARDSVAAWVAVVEAVAPTTGAPSRRPERVAVVTQGEESERRARRMAAATSTAEVEVLRAESRAAALARTASEWIVFLDEGDEPDDSLLEALVAAQAATGADAVTVAVRPPDDPDGVQLFLGDPGPLGLFENQYGVLGLVRRDLAAANTRAEDAVDPDWPLLARIALAGGRIVSIPEPLATHAGKPGRVTDLPGEGLAVLHAFEESGADFPDLPQFAATLAATLQRHAAAPAPPCARPAAQRLRRRIAILVHDRRRS